jgi:WD40 repeat protein
VKYSLAGRPPLAFSPNGKLLACVVGGPQNRIAIRTLGTEGTQTQLRTGASDIKAISFSQSGMELAVGTDEGTVQFWNTRSWRVARTLPGFFGEILNVTYSPDDNHLAVISEDGSVRIVDRKDGRFSATMIVPRR